MKEDPHISQALDQLGSIRKLMDAYRTATEQIDCDNAIGAIHASALDIRVRPNWYRPGTRSNSDARRPIEYYIVLLRGSPAVRVKGYLNSGEPICATLEAAAKDIPWQAVPATSEEEMDLLAYAACFNFGN
jgi:hypothetical protein